MVFFYTNYLGPLRMRSYFKISTWELLKNAYVAASYKYNENVTKELNADGVNVIPRWIKMYFTCPEDKLYNATAPCANIDLNFEKVDWAMKIWV